MVIDAKEERLFHWGKLSNSKLNPIKLRIHFGSRVDFVRISRRRNDFRVNRYVPSYCGQSITVWESDSRFPIALRGEFCRSCMRTYAFKIMEEYFSSVANGAVMSAKLLELLEKSAQENWTDERFREAVRSFAEEASEQEERILSVPIVDESKRVKQRNNVIRLRPAVAS